MKVLGRLFAVSLLLLALLLLVVFAPSIVTPFAKLWYVPGFGGSVEEAMKAVPGSEDVCIYDDTRGIFVASIQQLDVGAMIEAAVNHRFPIPRNSSFIEPHFRIYAGGETYYWSFLSQEFKRFIRSGFSLVEVGMSLCKSYESTPDSYESLFREATGIPVSRENFCCIAE